MTTDFDLVSNKSLFQTFDETQKIPEQLWNFLCAQNLPWQSLGAPLTNFINAQINMVAANERLKGNIHPSSVIQGDVVIEAGAIVEPFAFIQGPTYVCAGAIVRHGAYVRGSVYLSPGSVVGHTSEVKGSVLLPNAKAAHFAYVGDSILGVNCNLGAGTKLANLRFDHANVRLKIDGARLDSGLKKFGAILGNGSQTGCNSVTNPGTILLPNAMIAPCKNAIGIVRA